ncbi:MAG: sugar phosphate isomerase/epimerase family protein [Vicinamibacteraceae bacterium]
MSLSSSSRRQFLATTGVALTGPALVGRIVFGSSRPAQPAASKGLKIGVASYSLRKFPLDAALKMCQEMGVEYITLKDVHLPRTDAPETIRANREKIEAAGLTIMGGGTITWKVNDEAEIRKDFEYAKAGGFPTIVCSPAPEALDTVETLVKEYDIKIAIHNHGPEDEWYPAPKDALDALKDRDPRMGICMDIGHSVRAGADIVESVSLAGPRLLDLHIKDLSDKNDKESQVEVGKGALDIPGLFRALLKADFAGHVALEYEINESDPLVGMKESLAYERGVHDALSSEATS